MQVPGRPKLDIGSLVSGSFLVFHGILSQSKKSRTLTEGNPALWIFFFSLSLTKRRLNQIPHKPRFHTGLRAVRQSNGFIVGITT